MGWMFIFTHAGLASFFLSLIFIHIIRAIDYSTFQTPKHKTLTSGLLLLLLIMLTAFIGYVLPFGQMSF